MSWLMDWLADPVKVSIFVIRLCTATAMVVPVYFAWVLNAPGFLLLEFCSGLPMWVLLGIAVHGAQTMIYSGLPAKVWLWKTVTAWWENPK